MECEHESIALDRLCSHGNCVVAACVGCGRELASFGPVGCPCSCLTARQEEHPEMRPRPARGLKNVKSQRRHHNKWH